MITPPPIPEVDPKVVANNVIKKYNMLILNTSSL
jgi:hypothetical protein